MDTRDKSVLLVLLPPLPNPWVSLHASLAAHFRMIRFLTRVVPPPGIPRTLMVLCLILYLLEVIVSARCLQPAD